MPSQLLPVSLRAVQHRTVQSVPEEQLLSLLTAVPGVLATNSSDVGVFCAYFVPHNEETVYRASARHPLRVKLKKRVKALSHIRFLDAKEQL